MKKYENMTDRELLEQLVAENKKNNNRMAMSVIVNMVQAAILIFLLVVFVPNTMSVLTDLGELVEKTNEIVLQADESLDQIDIMVKNVNTLVEDNDEAIDESIRKISEIDIDSLNKSIKQLGDVIEPLSRFFKGFNGVSNFIGR